MEKQIVRTSHMKKLISTCFSLLPCLTFASTWVELQQGSDTNMHTYVDIASTTRNEEKIIYWTRTTWDNSTSFYLSNQVLDCKKKKYMDSTVRIEGSKSVEIFKGHLYVDIPSEQYQTSTIRQLFNMFCK